jgi:hypothetical protein
MASTITLKITGPQRLRLREAIAYKLELPEDGDGLPPGQARLLERVLEQLDAATASADARAAGRPDPMYERGWREGVAMAVEILTNPEIYLRDQLSTTANIVAAIEKVKPCPTCKGRGAIEADVGDAESGPQVGWVDCAACTQVED